jgi:hypothetical protein
MSLVLSRPIGTSNAEISQDFGGQDFDDKNVESAYLDIYE